MRKSHWISIIQCFLVYTTGLDNIRAQQFEWISDSFPGLQVIGIIEKDGKYFAAVSNGALFDYDINTIYQLSIYELELDHAGDPGLSLYEIKSIGYPENYATIVVDYIEETNVWLVVQSSVITPGNQKYRVILYDEDFDILIEDFLDTLGYPIPFHIDTYNGKTFILGSILGPPHDELFYLEYSHQHPFYLPPIKVGQSDPNPMFFITSMNVDPRTGNMLVFYYNGIAVLDSNLHQVKRFDHLSNIYTSDHGNVIGIGNHYYSHGARDYAWNNGIRRLVFHQYDTSFNILIADTFGIENHDNYPFIHTSIDNRNGEILIGGHLDGPFNNNEFDKSIKKFYLAKYDEEMNQLWYKEYGGDRAYILFGLKLLADGGSLAYGYITDTLDGYRYAYIIHVDSNGEILTTQVIPPEPHLSIQIVNPGDETLCINNPEGLVARILLFNLNGNEVFTGTLNSGITEFHVDELPAGLYPYTLIQDEKVISSGKWTKVK